METPRDQTPQAPQFQLSRWVFLRLLGLTYLLAFASLAPQIVGLIGAEGLLPVDQYLDRARQFYGSPPYHLLPTFLWLAPSDTTVQVLTWGGIVLSGFAITGLAPVLTFALLWACYLSLTVAGQTFLLFQWDALLLETGLLACLYAPLGWFSAGTTSRRPSRFVRWLLWGLAFKLTFLSGVTKLSSGDETWRALTALTFHYETQPIPAWTSWFAHHAPLWLQQTSAVGMFGIELVVPFFIFVPLAYRRTRLATCLLLCLLQAAIAATGNYGFFNLLTVVLYLTLLDDRHIRAVLPRRVAGRLGAGAPTVAEPAPWRLAIAGLVLVIGCLNVVKMWHEVSYGQPHPGWSNRLMSLVEPIRSINGYGLFRTMTTNRPELILEGTDDGVAWKEYVFRWKLGAPDRRPRFVQPHMPRLDWLMWFAALDPYGHQRWLGPLVDRLLTGSPTVVSLLASNPFPDSPPQSVRIALYDYRFTTPAERAATGAWWHRELQSYLTEPMSLR